MNKMMSENLELFGTPSFKLSRTNDPETSKAAANYVDTNKLEKIVYEAIRRFPDGCISDELLEALPQYRYSSITARYRPLLDKNFIEIVGERVGKSGRKQRIMKAIV